MHTLTTVQTKTPPQQPSTPNPPTFTVVTPEGGTQVLSPPTTPEEVAALRSRREQLSDQLENVSDRRSGLVQELNRTSVGAARPGLEARIQLLDQRILQLERDLSTTGQQLAAAPAGLGATTESQDVINRGPQSDNFDEGMAAGAFTATFFMTVLLLFLRRRWKGKGKGKQPQLGTDASQRLERLENGMDAIAIEIERVSEGQRFVTKLLSESHGAQAMPQRVGPQTILQPIDPTKG